jgi:hypothetical protein
MQTTITASEHHSSATATVLRRTIANLAGLLTGGAVVTSPVQEAEREAAAHPAEAERHDLMTMNPHIPSNEIGDTIAAAAADLRAITPGLGTSHDPYLAAFLEAYEACKSISDGDATELEETCEELRSRFEELHENLG